MTRLTPYIQLLRLDKPTGIWLVFFPAAWGVLLAPVPPQPGLLALMLLGAALTRAGGCIINDMTDRRLDARVARTRARPLASGAISARAAIGMLALLGAASLGVALLLPPPVLTLAALAAPLIAAYPWMKRFTWWPQAFLGITFNLGALIGWAATGTPLAAPAFLLYAACLCWTVGYDTIYAVQDMRDDAQVGIKSSARRLGGWLRPFVACCYGGMLLLLLAAGRQAGLGPLYPLLLLPAALHAGWQVTRLSPAAPHRAGRLFRSNTFLGLWVSAALMLARSTIGA